ncbi:hypothetical protein [Luteibacter sp. 22Crub2.1]|uniref:hypothetical protein n=1 Tax=Luteibacter sp. 22Crub2.1 TaxID=1283288 RepID=UPI0009A7E6B0|nr:hypothetical protein [Luteibacter sp. 22Crub2.1]
MSAASPIFNTSCAADVYAKPISGLPAVSHGTSTVSRVGYNSGRGISNNCSVSWVGTTDVAVGAEPYGGHVVVAFACQALKPGSIGTAMSLRYADATYSQWATSQSDVASAIG